MTDTNYINIDVIYATANREYINKVRIQEGSTYEDAILKSKVLDVFSELSLQTLKFGSYGKIKKLSDVLTSFDRVEIYRPITADVRSAMRSAGAILD